MGWLFAVALGMQERSSRAVWGALGPISVGHALSISLVVALAGLAQAILPLSALKIGAVILFTFGLYHLVRHKHFRYGGMQVGFGDLTIWSFLMASAHGAGLMVLPVLFGMRDGDSIGGLPASMHYVHLAAMGGSATNLSVVLVHTLAYLVVTGFVAWVVYEKLGLALLRKAWLNLDLIWAVALVATGCLVLMT